MHPPLYVLHVCPKKIVCDAYWWKYLAGTSVLRLYSIQKKLEPQALSQNGVLFATSTTRARCPSIQFAQQWRQNSIWWCYQSFTKTPGHNVCFHGWRDDRSLFIGETGGQVGNIYCLCVFSNSVSPRIGRKHTITITVLGIIIFNTLSGLTGSFNIYVGAKFATGFFCAGNILAMFVLSNELVGGSKRALVGTTMQVTFLERL